MILIIIKESDKQENNLPVFAKGSQESITL